MSAREPPTPDELLEEFPLSPEEAELLAEALTPVQNITGAGSSVGNAMEDMPGEGPKLAGTALRNISTHANLAGQTAELLARSLRVYAISQGKATGQLFPTPPEVGEDIQTQADILVDALTFGEE